MSVSSSPAAPPRHVAVIMDGNGRWAAERGLPRSAGHKQGIESLRRTVKAAADMGIEYLTVYSFSTENWSRPKAEVQFLLQLFRRFIRQDVAELHSNGIRVRMIGTRAGLDSSILKMIDDTEALTTKNTGLTLVIAFNYGARQELVRAMQALAAKVQANELAPQDISMELVTAHLDTHDMPEPDLLIRTGGEERLSNFLLWQSAYTEFVFTQDFWPDFDGAALEKAIATFKNRDRRFGGLKVQSA
jgi:undecaprenyl diphosphate synthase